MPLLLPGKAAPSKPGDPPQPWNRTSVTAHISQNPSPYNEKASGGPWAGMPLKDRLNHFNLSPLLILPTRWPQCWAHLGERTAPPGKTFTKMGSAISRTVGMLPAQTVPVVKLRLPLGPPGADLTCANASEPSAPKAEPPPQYCAHLQLGVWPHGLSLSTYPSPPHWAVPEVSGLGNPAAGTQVHRGGAAGPVKGPCTRTCPPQC